MVPHVNDLSHIFQIVAESLAVHRARLYELQATAGSVVADALSQLLVLGSAAVRLQRIQMHLVLRCLTAMHATDLNVIRHI